MSAPTVLFIGGTGIISSAASALAVERGFDVTLLNRGRSSLRPAAEGAEVLVADGRDPEAVRRAIGDRDFDVVIDVVAFTAEHVARDVETFSGRTGQFVFISSASAYQKPPLRLPVLESTPLRNPYWQYSRDKIACEDVLVSAYRETGFPVTIVRPSHTYDRTSIPLNGGWTAIDRMRRGAPVVLHDHGSALWVLTHTRDFAAGFVGLLGNNHAIGDSVHITSDEVVSWTQITALLADAAGVEPHVVHVTSDALAAADPEMGAGHLGDRSHSMIFDNSKIKSLVPGFAATTGFAEGAREIIDWYDANPQHQVVDERLDALFDALAASAG
ncbi:MAG: NAD-dependent dehydratase [Microbacteriaceae bacterium]|nr:NAD-dependent dehydratase [Microbacteriaceae bacterium]